MESTQPEPESFEEPPPLASEEAIQDNEPTEVDQTPIDLGEEFSA